MFDLRSLSLDEMYRCSAELRSIGEVARDADDAAQRTVSYLFEHFRCSDTGALECPLVRLFATRPLSSLDEEEAARARAACPDNTPNTVALSLRATRGIEPEWNDPARSKRHRVMPLASPSVLSNVPMVAALISQLGVPAEVFSGAPFDDHTDMPLFNVFHVEKAVASPLVPDQSGFVAPYGVQSVLGFGGLLPRLQVFVVILFSNVTIPASTADLFRTLAPSVGLALLTRERDRESIGARLRSYELIVRHHEKVALNQNRRLEQIAGELARSLAERQQFEALVENCPDFVGIAHPDGTGIYLNPAGRRMVGLSPSFDVTRVHMADFSLPCDRWMTEEEVIPLTLAQGHWAGETTLRHWQTNAGIPVSDHHFTIREPKTDRLLGLGTILRDISEKRREAEEREHLLADAQLARAEAQAASRAKDDFLASLGHELRNPLSPILTAVELMKLRGTRAKELEVIKRQVVHLARLVDDLLDVSRIARGKLEVQRTPTELAAIVARAVEILSPTYEQRRQRLLVDVAEEGLLVNADPGRLAQVVANLLDNASKYSPRDSEVFLTAKRIDERVQLRVRDQGVGIPAHMLGTIFESFVQHREGGSAPLGLGLGLAIARSLVELHEGAVYARSEGPGHGSEFVVELPLVLAPRRAPERPREESAHGAHCTRVRRVLVVDDNADAANLLCDALEELGLEVRVARDGPSALELAESFDPEVALLDIGLPVMDGYQLACRLRGLSGAHKQPRLIAVSGYGRECDHRRSLEAGFAAHLVKPVELDALMEAIGLHEEPADEHAGGTLVDA